MKTILLFATLLASTLSLAQIHQACHSENHDSRTFGIAYGARKRIP